jgi:hypothetical protein
LTSGWRRLGERLGTLGPDETLYEGVPDHLWSSLMGWLDDRVRGDEPLLAEIELRLRTSRPLRRSISINRELLLDAIDLTLWILKQRFDEGIEWQKRIKGVEALDRRTLLGMGLTSAAFRDQQAPTEVARLLELGGSVWRVSGDGGSLERRVDPTVAAAGAEAAPSESSAAHHLSAGWQAAYGRHADPSRAYSEAIKAVEAAAAPVVLPNDQLATLGKIIAVLRQAPRRWELVIPGRERPTADISALVAMLELLWQGQTDRHGGVNPTRPIPQEAGPAAVHLGVTLVQWFQSGMVRRTTTGTGAT